MGVWTGERMLFFGYIKRLNLTNFQKWPLIKSLSFGTTPPQFCPLKILCSEKYSLIGMPSIQDIWKEIKCNYDCLMRTSVVTGHGYQLVVITFSFFRSRASTSEYEQLPINCRLFQNTVNLQDKCLFCKKTEIKNWKQEIWFYHPENSSALN